MPWAKGQSGNPGGRPKVVAKVREMAQRDTPEAYETLRSLMLTADKDSVRLAAAIAILKMAGVSLSSLTDGEMTPQTYNLPSQSTSTAQLLALVKPPSTNSGGQAN